VFIDPKSFKSRLDFDKALVRILREEKINLVVLAGFMRILTPYFVGEFRNRILNIHPAILPAFRGQNSIKRAYGYGCKITGVTVHLVDNAVDRGPIILQDIVPIEENMPLAELEEEIHRLEHKLYPLAIKLFIDGKIKIRGRRVKTY
jgi:phosphoribosylglycinamide formyltransferase-1